MSYQDTIFTFLARQLDDGVDRVLCDGGAGETAYFDQGQFVFSLKGLYRLLDSELGISFGAFQRAIYQGSLNQRLFELGAEVVVFRNDGKVNQSLYCLRQLPAA